LHWRGGRDGDEGQGARRDPQTRETRASGRCQWRRAGLAIAIVYQDEVVYLGGFGVREVGKPDPVDTDTVFQLASFSKPISSTIVAALVSDGVVSWDTRIISTRASSCTMLIRPRRSR
jgi:CubicO group peptidase (beta-lactamase class C family)